MIKVKEVLNKLFQWFAALLVAIFIINAIMFFYDQPTCSIPRTDAATNYIWDPGTNFLHGFEGRGRHHVDRNGYINADLPVGEYFTLVMGASHAQGKEVSDGKRYSDILNDKLADSMNELTVYNCAQDAHYLPEIVSRFYALTMEFPDAENIIIDTERTNFSKTEWIESLNQCDFDEKQLGSNLLSALSNREKMILKLKEKLPLVRNIKRQMDLLKKGDTNLGGVKTNIDIEETYIEALNNALALIRSQYNGRLIIIYHPAVSIEDDGTMSLKVSNTDTIFAKACKNNDIIFVDMSESFRREYDINYNVPYGFSNTSMAEGHLNETGHKLIADKLYKILTYGEDK